MGDEDDFWNIQLGVENSHNDSDDDDDNLFHATGNGTTWLAPQEREGLNISTKNKNNDNNDGVDANTEDEENFLYEWIHVPLPLMRWSSRRTLPIRSMKSSLSLMESHVGEEVWDAAKLFSTHLCMIMSNKKNDNEGNIDEGFSDCPNICNISVKGKRVLELGAGCGLLGMCCSVLGASEVLCTDYLPEVMNNLAFNLTQHNNNTTIMENEHEHDIPTSNNTFTTSDNKPNQNEERKPWIKCGILDWQDFVAEDIKEAEWMNDEVFCSSTIKNDQKEDDDVYYTKKVSTFIPDIIVGTALVYSAQGGIYCADTIQYYFETHHVKEVFVLQMTGRPGFDRFLMRLDHWGINYEAFEVSEKVFDYTCVTTAREAFKLLKITPKL